MNRPSTFTFGHALVLRGIGAVILATCLAGCSKEPSIDATSMKTLKASSEALRATLSADDALRYDASVTSIIVATVDPMTTLQIAGDRGALPTQEGVFQQIKPVFDDKTFKDIIADGKAAETKVQAQLAAWTSQKKKLETAQKQYTETATFAAKFAPTSADLRLANGVTPIFGDNQVEVDVEFKNNTGAPVEAMTFDLALMPPTVSTPWVMHPITKKFDTPIAPGGTAKVKAGPINVAIPESYKGDVKLEADIQVTSVQLQGKPAVTVVRWDESNLITLSKLEASITGIQQALDIVKGAK